MNKRTYPYQAWVLRPSFKPAEITLVGERPIWGSESLELDENGQSYGLWALFTTKELAIAAGRKRIVTQQADLDKRHIGINKRIAALDKASK